MTIINIIGFGGSALVIWFVASLFLLAHAVMIRDVVFIFLQATNTILTAVILAYAQKYKNGVCTIHGIGKTPF